MPKRWHKSIRQAVFSALKSHRRDGSPMREEAQYKVTPYFGKWHLSYRVSDLEKYGYTSYSPNQDYWGYAGQGLATDDTPAWEAAHWINNRAIESQLT
jgi:hypothetical protein